MKRGSFIASRAGNVALIFAIMAPVLILSAGGVVDIGHFLLRKSQIQDAADAASVASISKDSSTYQAGLAMSGDGPITGGQPAAQKLFDANRPTMNDTGVSPVAWSGARSGNMVNDQITIQATFHTDFLRMIGMADLPIYISSRSTSGIPPYINVYVVVDVSQSMGIASTQSDMDTLYQRVVNYNNGSGNEKGCVFGCHVAAPSTQHSGQQYYTNEYLAHNVSPSVTLRIDSAVAAIQDIISQAQNSGTGGKIKIGIYAISDNPNNGTNITQIAAPSANYGTLSTTAKSLDLGGNDSGGEGDTNPIGELTTFYNTYLPAQGDGSTAAAPQNYVYIVTDGLIDRMPIQGQPCAGFSNHCMAAFDPSICSTIKNKAQVGVIYTTYNPIYNNDNPSAGTEANYNTLVKPYVNSIQPNLQSCASSSSLFFQASDGPDIVKAMSQLFTATLATAHITN